MLLEILIFIYKVSDRMGIPPIEAARIGDRLYNTMVIIDRRRFLAG